MGQASVHLVFLTIKALRNASGKKLPKPCWEDERLGSLAEALMAYATCFVPLTAVQFQHGVADREYV